MNITYHEASRSFRLDAGDSSYIIGIVGQEGFLGHAYYGPTIGADDVTYLFGIGRDYAEPTEEMRDRSSFLDAFPMEYAGDGVGDYRESAIGITDAGGHHGVQLTYRGHRIYTGKPKLTGLPATFATEAEAMTLEIDVTDETLRLEGTLIYTVFADNGAITRSMRLTNASDEPIYLDKVMSLCMDVPDEDYEMLSLHGSWARERRIQCRPLGYGKSSINSTRGESSHQEHPFLALVGKTTTQESGPVYGFHFVYSGNFLGQVEKSQFDSLRVLMGIHPEGFRWKLSPGESFQAPEVVMVYSDAGLGAMSRTYHDLYRNHLIRSPYLHKPRPVLINNWEATYFDFDEAKLLDIAKTAKACGIEMLVMDDGWFGKRNDDNTSLGDWQVNTDKLPGGLKHLVDEVNTIGLQFGIWFEPEMISPDSDLFRAHPDWMIHIPERTPCRSRNQYVLDITRAEVRDYAYQCVADILHSANIAYVKWDMNRQLSDIGSLALPADRQGELMHRYVLAVYEMQERLVTEFPDLLLENCSGGGARFDPGMLYYSPQIWCSDDTDAIERLSIQEGTALLYPLSTIGAHVSACPNHTVGRNTPFATRADVALAGTFGYELDITKLSREERAEIPTQIATYHRYQELMREGDYYRLASYGENHYYDCYEVVSKDRREVLVTFVQVLAKPNAKSIRIRLAGLDPDKKYHIEEEKITVYGSTLLHAGLLIQRPWGDFQSKRIHITEE